MNKKKFLLAGAVVALSGLFWLITKTNNNKSGNQISPPSLTRENQITHGHGLAADVADPNRLYIATHHGLLILLNDQDLSRMGKSRDDYMGFSLHPLESRVFFSSGHPAAGGNLGFQKSIDGGETWQKISDGLDEPVDFHALAVSPVNPNLVFGWYRGNLQRSDDGGKNWRQFATPVPMVALAADTREENVVYAASPQGLFKSQDKGESWVNLLDGFVATVAVSPSDSLTLLVSSEKLGLARSGDGGQSWQKIPGNFNGELPLFISFNRQNPPTVYLLTEKNGLYKSTDTGNTWSKVK